jgi:hypothetical protein
MLGQIAVADDFDGLCLQSHIKFMATLRIESEPAPIDQTLLRV